MTVLRPSDVAGPRWRRIRSTDVYAVTPRRYPCVAEYGVKRSGEEVTVCATMAVPAYTKQDEINLRPLFAVVWCEPDFSRPLYTHYRIRKAKA